MENKVSFFDDDDTTVGFDFRKPTKAHTKDLNHPALIRSPLIKQLPNNTSQTEGFYAIHNKCLVYYKNNTYKTPETVLDLSHARIKVLTTPSDSHLHGFSLWKNGKGYEFYTNDPKLGDDWATILKSICVLTSFHDEYKALKMIGKGSFAKVYLVEAKTNNKLYAVKAFTKESVISSNKTNAKPSMFNEIDIMRALDHENVIKLYEVHETEKSIYFVLELIQGKSMQDILKKSTFKDEYSEVKIINMIRSILDVLAYLASKGVMHRDLKPDNILIDKECKVKIADFGLATFTDVPEYIFKKCGTPGYIAPEVFKYDQKIASTNYDHQCDVFSAGCILYYMLFGTPFFEASNASEILRLNRKFTSEFDAVQHVKAEIKNSNSKISKDGLNLLLQLLEFDPKRRVLPAQALCHSYFTPVPHGMQKMTGSNDMISEYTPKNTHTPKNQVNSFNLMSPKNNPGSPANWAGFGKVDSPKTPGGNFYMKERFAEKDSLYLDMGKPEMTGRMDTINNASQNNSLLLKKGSHNSVGSGTNPDSFSGFASQYANSERKNKASKGQYGAGNGGQSVLKAALLRNMHKNNSDAPNGEESKEDAVGSPINKSLSERFSHLIGFGQSEGNSSNSPDGDSGDDNDYSQSPKHYKAPVNGDDKKRNSFTKRRFQPFAQKAAEATSK